MLCLVEIRFTSTSRPSQITYFGATNKVCDEESGSNPRSFKKKFENLNRINNITTGSSLRFFRPSGPFLHKLTIVLHPTGNHASLIATFPIRMAIRKHMSTRDDNSRTII